MKDNPGAPPPTLGDALRTVLAVLAILPGLLVGVFTGLFSGDRRRAVNQATRLWGRQGTRAAGIRLSVDGRERLSVRPAIFTLNHQSGIDPILVCALLREDFVAVAKSEIRKNPVLGPAFAFVGTVFVDRDRGQDPERAMRPAVEACAQGLALVLAPEGTRSEGQAVGLFKKGAVHAAVATGVPLIPIVIHNAGDILPFGGFIMRRGEVRVEVLEPIPTEDWTLDSVDTETAALEERYREALGAGKGFVSSVQGKESVAFYDKNAEAFVADTQGADVSKLRARFLAELPQEARILDAGSGAGRDAATFHSLGHEVRAIDGSAAMAQATRDFAGVPTEHTLFLDYEPDILFDGIWACASLLHVPMAELPATLSHLASLLEPGGVLFASFKEGETEEHRNERFFRDLNPVLLEDLVGQVPTLETQEVWTTPDARPERHHELWLNAILRRV